MTQHLDAKTMPDFFGKRFDSVPLKVARMFAGYGRQKGWERENARTEPATDSGNGTEKIPEGFTPVPEQMELPF